MNHSVLLGVIAIAITIICFYCYHFLTAFGISSRLFWSLFPEYMPPTARNFISAKVVGFIFLGFLPFVVFVLLYFIPIEELGFSFGETGRYWYLAVIVPLFFILFSFLASQNSKNREVSPQMRLHIWTPGYLLISFTGWGAYLLAYEFLFRGVLWFSCFNAFGFWPAFVINLALYSSLHIPKGFKETMGAIPFGALVCFTTWLTGSFYIAFLTHYSMAASMEFFSVYFNPEMKFIRRKNQGE
ncbi:MAG: CPBP family intramembrane metalloprotease [Bacteroidota bacterium]|nr:CPBP family intramembrane metalloprotease [Bacteroidota bacterium]